MFSSAALTATLSSAGNCTKSGSGDYIPRRTFIVAQVDAVKKALFRDAVLIINTFEARLLAFRDFIAASLKSSMLEAQTREPLQFRGTFEAPTGLAWQSAHLQCQAGVVQKVGTTLPL